ncbi:MAG: Glycosyl transferase family 2 [Candidatus Uhrbacteria bacterium GW2011_GWF2_39_13]|uniref:Glycosyl transferase family 2 n=1 Tax=Candidatus Uhrbacteria bacterium GW2011_GWF2_39_13 TaxID=1618995 RepID=A0A0G0MUA2_9BACT|nr:MAG: Glycosyl transferase family 2 [Candidatus Uhrbacteria bacterium GW2011_GWF2_39_13]
MNSLKVSVITVVFNNAAMIEHCINSVRAQTYADIEHIIVDGGSTDGTVEIINKYQNSQTKVVSEPDKGLYDAMNKGIMRSTGDIVGILNSDDFYPNDLVIEKVVRIMSEKQVESCYGDAVYVQRDNVNRIMRYWKSGKFSRNKFKIGWMPQHGTFYVKKGIYTRYGLFNDDFPIAADYELILRFLYKHKITAVYLPEILLKIRAGGLSKPGIVNTSKMFFENYKASKINGIKYPMLVCFLKRLLKILQFITKP